MSGEAPEGGGGAQRRALFVPEPVAAVFALVQHFAIGSIGFLGFYALALLLSAAVQWLNGHAEHPVWLSAAGGWIEAVLFGADFIALALFIVSEIAKFSRRLWREWRRS